MKYTVDVQLNTGLEFIYRVKAENSKEAIIKVMNELSDIQCHFLIGLQVTEQVVYRQVVYKEL